MTSQTTKNKISQITNTKIGLATAILFLSIGLSFAAAAGKPAKSEKNMPKEVSISQCVGSYRYGEKCPFGYKSIEFFCEDGYESALGGPTSCKPPDVWLSAIQQVCSEHCANCRDTDEGVNYQEFGSVSYNLNYASKFHQTVNDSCAEDDHLLERYCDENGIARDDTSHWCEFGCRDGLCLPEPSPIEGYCYLDHAIRIASYHSEPYIGEEQRIESVSVSNRDECRDLGELLVYRFAKHYHTTPAYALVCTDACPYDPELPHEPFECSDGCTVDREFFEASIEGYRLGIQELERRVGYLPPTKMEMHIGSDGDCFQGGYENRRAHTGESIWGHTIVCNHDHYQYLLGNRTLEEQRTLASQTLTIHEPIHRVFAEYAQGGSSPRYRIQEAFCKGVSLNATGVFPGYDNEFYTNYGEYDIDNPPPAGSPARDNFLIYSLHQRFGFDEEEDTLEFFRLYRERQNENIHGDLKVKQILDTVLGQDTTVSFRDVGIEF